MNPSLIHLSEENRIEEVIEIEEVEEKLKPRGERADLKIEMMLTDSSYRCPDGMSVRFSRSNLPTYQLAGEVKIDPQYRLAAHVRGADEDSPFLKEELLSAVSALCDICPLELATIDLSNARRIVQRDVCVAPRTRRLPDTCLL